MKKKIAEKLREWADILDTDGAMTTFSGYFNIVSGKGLIVTKTDGYCVNRPSPGTQLYYKVGEYRGIEYGQ